MDSGATRYFSSPRQLPITAFGSADNHPRSATAPETKMHRNPTSNPGETVMKTFILAALVAVSALATGVVTANADTFSVHGYQGTNYGR
jgi:hypothetical protein